MESRIPVSPETVEGMAREIAGLPLSSAAAKEHAASFEPVMQMIESLRDLPLKEIEPALVFRPKEE